MTKGDYVTTCIIDVSTTLPDGHVVQMPPSARDAFAVFEDLCLLVNSDKPRFLKLQSLPKTFGLELVESVLTNYHALFRNVSVYHYHQLRSSLTSTSTASRISHCTSTSLVSDVAQVFVGAASVPHDTEERQGGLSNTQAIQSRFADRGRSIHDVNNQDSLWG